VHLKCKANQLAADILCHRLVKTKMWKNKVTKRRKMDEMDPTMLLGCGDSLIYNFEIKC
jgi:hypothetical protein